MPEAPAAPLPRLNLALQGGGSHGALTWGVLDALLEDGQWQFDGVSGTSAGAMNAVALAHGFATAAKEHKDPHEAHQAGCQQARDTLTRLWEGVGTLGSLMWGSPLSAANPMLGMISQWLSPYQTNPLDINPLRRLLEREVDFDLLCSERRAISAAGGPKVFVCATNVRTGRGELVPVLRAKVVGLVVQVVEQVDSAGIEHAAGRRTGRIGLEPPCPDPVHDRLGDDRAGRVVRAEKENVQRSESRVDHAVSSSVRQVPSQAAALARMSVSGTQISGAPLQQSSIRKPSNPLIAA